MSYYVEYNPESKRKYPIKRSYKRKFPKKVVGILIICVCIYAMIQCGFHRYLLPGDPDVTVAALSTLVQQMGEGEPVKDAILTFCEEVITQSGK